MKFAITLLSALLLFPAKILFAQNDAVKTVIVSKHFTIKTDPRNADIFSVNAYGGEEKLGNDSFSLRTDKNEDLTIEVRKEGYRSVRKIYRRQKGGVDEDIIELPTRVIKLTVSPGRAAFIVNNISRGNGEYELVIPKNERASVEVKYPGFVTVTKTFYNKPGEEDPKTAFHFKLEDRIITIKALPGDAFILSDGKNVGQGTADVVVKRNTCVAVSLEHPGYVPESVQYCNNDNGPELALADEIQLKDRVAQFNAEPENAVISIDGKATGKSTCDVKIPEGKCVEVLIQAPGYATILKSICNQPGVSAPEVAYPVKLAADEVNMVSEESSVVNSEFTIDINPALHANEAWKKLCTIMQAYFETIELQDAQAAYLRTKWDASAPFNTASSFPRIIRTRVVIKSGGANPLKYIINIQSEISRMSKECKPGGKYEPESMDACFDPLPRMLRKYRDMVSELQARIGYDPAAVTQMAAPAVTEEKMPVTQKSVDGPVVAMNNDGDYFMGTWHCINAADTITISKNSECYLLDRRGKKVKLNYRDDALLASADPALGKVTFKNAHLFWQEKEFEDVSIAAAANDKTVQTTDGAAVNKPESSNADVFTGTWHCITGAATITISKDGGNFILDSEGRKTTLTYQDNVLKNADPALGKVIFNSMSGHIFWRKKEFEYADVTPQASNDGAGNTSGNSTGANNDAPNTVGSFMNDKLSSQQSVLFHFTGDYNHPKEKIYLDFFQEQDNNFQQVANAVYNGIINTGCFKRVAFDKYAAHANDTVFYLISYSIIEARTDYFETPYPDYVATTSVKVSVTDADGYPVWNNTFRQGQNTMSKMIHLRIGNEAEAIRQSAGKLADQVTEFFSEKFPVITTVNSITEPGHDGSAKMILLNGGENMGLSVKSKLKIMDNGKQIGEVKVKSVDQKTATCKVEDGGEVITLKLNAGYKLEAISE